jgi:DNA-binding beta-propeller fold protein YncE
MLAALILVPVLADSPKGPTGKAPLELLVHRFRAPTGVAVDPDGTVLFTDRKEGRLWQRAPNGSFTILLDRLEHPRGLLRAEDGTLFLVADGLRESKKGAGDQGVLLKRDPHEETVTILSEEFRKPKQLALDRDNQLLLSTRGGLRDQADREGEAEWEERDDDEDNEDNADAEDDEKKEELPTGFRGTIFRIHPADGQILASHRGFRLPSGVVGDEAGTLTVAATAFKLEGSALKGSLFQVDPTGKVTVLVEDRFRQSEGTGERCPGTVLPGGETGSGETQRWGPDPQGGPGWKPYSLRAGIRPPLGPDL